MDRNEFIARLKENGIPPEITYEKTNFAGKRL